MKTASYVCLLLTAILASPTWASVEEERIFHYIEEVKTPNTIIDQFETREKNDAVTTVIVLDKIVNIASKVWKIVEDNRPVVDVRYTYANALPRGARSSRDLSGFSPLQFQSYRMYGKNLFGIEVYNVVYTLVHRYGGNYEGKGRYLEHVTILPHQVDTAWGYTLNMGVNSVSVVNVGTRTSPVASLAMEMNFRVATILKESRVNSIFEFRGDRSRVRTIRSSR